MVLLKTTPQILHAISSLPSSHADEEKHTAADQGTHPTRSKPLSLSSLPTRLEEPVSHTSLIAVSRALSSADAQFALDHLLRGTCVYVPPPAEKPAPSPEYVALKARLLKEEEQREYKRLVGARASEEIDTDNDGEDDNLSPSSVFNILLSVVLCGFAVFWATRYWPNQGLRVLLALAAALLVGVAESTVYAAYIRKTGSAREKAARLKERKTILEVDLPPADESEDASLEKEVIWGRGPNGGARRRVKDRWMKEQMTTELK
ncbi:MAG: hypothetical protein Q9227_005110 [Pyrenula ochraceoflavens]